VNPIADVAIYDFDNQTGNISNEVLIDAPNAFQSHGISFTSDLNSDLVYFNTKSDQSIWQYDIPTTNLNQIPTPANYDASYMQLGPDDNIYLQGNTVQNANALQRLANPHLLAPTFQSNSLTFNNLHVRPRSSFPKQIDGLKPPFIPLSFSINYISCSDIEITVPTCWSGYEYHIDWGDNTYTNSIVTPNNLPHTYGNTGNYIVTLTLLESGTIDP